MTELLLVIGGRKVFVRFLVGAFLYAGLCAVLFSR